MSNAFCLLNHQLTAKQIEELTRSSGSERINYPPEELAALWSAIPTDCELKAAHLAPFLAWLGEAREGDLVVLQGEFGAAFALVDFALQRGLVPVYAVTKRVAEESRDGEVVRRTYIFEHVCFRRYRYYGDLP
jgi:hypothetical protein